LAVPGRDSSPGFRQIVAAVYIYAAVEHGIWDDSRIVAAVSDRRNPNGDLRSPLQSVASVSDRREVGGQRPPLQKALPPEIAEGINDVSKRTLWNKPAPPEYALPTETWREVVARRTRCEEIRQKLATGEIHSINDLITYNLDIRRFAEEVIANCEGPELLRAFYKAIRSISVLDPACGSGAFLFAVLNILERLYDTCLVRMQAFVDDLDRSGEKHSPEKFKDFRQTLEEMNDKSRHPSPRYFILKSIILNNLYGVDIMEEATEICKLRLFLKLVAQVNPGEKIEPLPDIDFNIRAGNTIVGFVAKDAVIQAGRQILAFDSTLRSIEEQAEKAFRRFRDMQMEYGMPAQEFAGAKTDLQSRLENLRLRLDGFLAGQYRVEESAAAFAQWRASHHPFHWFVEFFGIMASGGFDVIVGNPPFVEYRKVRSQYTVRNFVSENCANLYAFMMERSAHLLQSAGHLGLIVPIAAISVGETETLRRLLMESFSDLWLSNYAIRPAKLFEGVEQRLTIAIGKRGKSEDHRICATKYNQWYVDERPHLFARLSYCDVTALCNTKSMPKIGDKFLYDIIQKVQQKEGAVVGHFLTSQSEHFLFFHRTPGYWIRIMDFEPYFKSPTHDRSIFHIRELHVADARHAKLIGSLVSSSLYFAWFFAVGNCRNLTLEDVKLFPLGKVSEAVAPSATNLFDRLMVDYKRNAVISRRGETEFQEFDWGASKPIVDEIDRVIGLHYGLTTEEIDYLVSYDIKIRLGRSSGEGDESDIY
jgi:hypothetical protein